MKAAGVTPSCKNKQQLSPEVSGLLFGLWQMYLNATILVLLRQQYFVMSMA